MRADLWSEHLTKIGIANSLSLSLARATETKRRDNKLSKTR